MTHILDLASSTTALLVLSIFTLRLCRNPRYLRALDGGFHLSKGVLITLHGRNFVYRSSTAIIQLDRFVQVLRKQAI